MRGPVPAFVERDDSARHPGAYIVSTVRAALAAARPPNRRTPPQFPIYVFKRPTKDQIPPYLSRPKAFPFRGRCPSAHTGADEGESLRRSASLIPTLISQPHG